MFNKQKENRLKMTSKHVKVLRKLEIKRKNRKNNGKKPSQFRIAIWVIEFTFAISFLYYFVFNKPKSDVVNKQIKKIKIDTSTFYSKEIYKCDDDFFKFTGLIPVKNAKFANIN